jgi:hypothetical protein
MWPDFVMKIGRPSILSAIYWRIHLSEPISLAYIERVKYTRPSAVPILRTYIHFMRDAETCEEKRTAIMLTHEECKALP